jgi:hypothetical protein
VKQGHFHAVRFYDNEVSLCRIVAAFLKEGLSVGHPGVVIATPEHTQGIIAELRAREIDVAAALASGQLVTLDAVQTMDTFMVDGVPNRDKFFEVANEVIQRATRGRKDRVVRAYGEMVDVLWREGRDIAAIQLEMLWNQLGRILGFSLLCGYAMGNFYKDASVQEVCRQHTHTIGADGTARISSADSLLIGALRQ